MWKVTYLPFSSADEGLKFEDHSLPSYQIRMTCVFDSSSHASHWVFTFQDMNYTDAPQCDIYCHESPQFENDGNLVMVWDEGHWSDSGATFKCVNGMC